MNVDKTFLGHSIVRRRAWWPIASSNRKTATLMTIDDSYNDEQDVSSMECIDARDILEYAPLDYPLRVEYFNQILQLGKALLVTKHA